MDSASKFKETIFSSSNSYQIQTATSASSNNENTNTISMLHHDLVSANSIELNTAASLSDDSGIPQTTNSSISSTDSYRLGVYKLEVEIVESDGEVSQFDSLDNCSEGGMSAENFNTLKKVPLAPIDPPPEFQDSPKATLLRTIPKNLVSSLRRCTSSQSSFEHLKDLGNEESFRVASSGDICGSSSVSGNYENASYHDDDKTLKDSYSVNKHLFASDSILTGHSENIYDEPNNITSSSLGNSFDIIESDSSSNLPPPSPTSPPLSVVKMNQILCPYFQDHTRYFKAIPSDQDRISIQKFNSSTCADIHNYDTYCAAKRTACYQLENSSQSKHLYSPFNSAHYCNHAGVISYGNRPLSRNSLNSRLSSSHNSLSVPSANKADDSIFITQAMSHDALLTKEITDFYNVPLDSDIYALPVDMIRSEKNSSHNPSKKPLENTSISLENESTHHRTNRNKRRKKIEATIEHVKNNETQKFDCNTPKTAYRTLFTPKLCEVDLKSGFSTIQEPLPISLNEAKQLYQSFYSNSQTESIIHGANSIEIGMSKETIWNVSSARSHSEISTKEKNAFNLKTDNINNNMKYKSENFDQAKPSHSEKKVNELQKASSTVNKQNNQYDKKFQFNLNLKQKFCSIFRFRRNYNRCRGRNSTQIDQTKESNYFQQVDESKKKFQSRALPPVPNKSEHQNAIECELEVKKMETQPFHFTTSIEKVKDYGWYWGPLSCEAAEKVLSNEPDGSFIVRDSSDDHYIFSLSFKLNNCVRHVRIEQDQVYITRTAHI